MSSQGVALVVDDEPCVRKALRFALAGMGYSVLEAGDGPQALRTARKQRPSLVLLDLNLPGMNGIEVLRRMKKLASGTPVIVLSGYGDMASARAAMRLGARDFLTKPFELETLEAALRQGTSESGLHG